MSMYGSVVKQYLQDTAVFADILNYYIYKGKQRVVPEQLREMDVMCAFKHESPFRIGEAVQSCKKMLEQAVMMGDDRCDYVILGVTKNSHLEYPVSLMCYTYQMLYYEQQVAEIEWQHMQEKVSIFDGDFDPGFRQGDHLKPIIMLLIYFGAERWEYDRSLHEIFRRDNSERDKILCYMPDYTMNLIEPATMTDTDIEKFKTDIRNVFSCIRCSRNPRELKNLLIRDDSFKKVRRQTAELLIEVFAEHEPGQNDSEYVNLCMAIQDMKGSTLQREE